MERKLSEVKKMDNNSEKVAQIVADSQLAFLNAQYYASLMLAKQALELAPYNSDAHQCAGNAYMSKADYESAIDHY